MSIETLKDQNINNLQKNMQILQKNIQKTIDKENNKNNISFNAEKKINIPADNKNDVPFVKEESKDDIEYTVSPDGKYKIPKPKKHADYLEKTPGRLPYITDKDVLNDYSILWVTDLKPHTITDHINMGYEFIDNNTKGCEHAIPTHSGYRPDGSAYMSYAMWMPLAKYKEIQRIKQNKITEKEQENLIRPSDNPVIYATKEMKLGGAAAKIVKK